MRYVFSNRFTTFGLRNFGFLLAATAAIWTASSRVTKAQDPTLYTLEASEDESVVTNDTMHSEMMAAWTTPMTLDMKRNRPYLLLTNTSDFDMTSFTLNIGTSIGLHANMPPQTFDWARIIPNSSNPAGTSPGVSASSITPDTLDQGAKGPQIVINFANSGLAPGQKVLFQVDIDPLNAGSSAFADYRQVFFTIGANEADPNTDGNAETSASFHDPASDQDINLPFATWDNQVDGRHTNYGTAVAAHYMDDFVRTFSTFNAVPEPSTLLLAGFGAIGLILGARQARRNKAII